MYTDSTVFYIVLFLVNTVSAVSIGLSLAIFLSSLGSRKE